MTSLWKHLSKLSGAFSWEGKNPTKKLEAFRVFHQERSKSQEARWRNTRDQCSDESQPQVEIFKPLNSLWSRRETE